MQQTDAAVSNRRTKCIIASN